MKGLEWWSVVLLLVITFIIGWVMNIVQIVRMIDGDITAMFIAKCIGIFAAPLGSVLGWIG